MIRLIAPPRGRDAHGSGAYGASRGSRVHKGVDYAAMPGSACLALVTGTVTKLGYPYKDDLSFRYVEVIDNAGCRARYFYIQPVVDVGDVVDTTTVLGHVQSLGERYAGITDHVHFEVRDADGRYMNPANYAETHTLL